MAKEITRSYRISYLIVRSPLRPLVKYDWRGTENLPKEGAFLAAANHATELDSMTFMDFLVSNGYPARVLAKEVLFRVPVLGFFLTLTKQIPVYRGSSKATDSLVSAREALRQGEAIAIFPEGSLTRDKDLWPMTGKSGAARLALETGAPVIPVAQWGAHRILGRYRRVIAPSIPRKTVIVQAGPAVDLADLHGKQDDREAVQEATRRIMAAITELLAGIRGEDAPAVPYDIKRDGKKTKKEMAAESKERWGYRKLRAAEKASKA